MNRWNVTVAVAATFLGFVLTSCASVGPTGDFTTYRDGLNKGTQYLQNGQYQLAVGEFLRANDADPSEPMPMALAGQATYYLNDYPQASEYLAKSLAIKSDSNAYLIVKAYQALIAFKGRRQQEGTAALGDYLRVYRVSFPEYTYSDVQRMYTLVSETGDINVAELEPVITDQVRVYENGLFQSL